MRELLTISVLLLLGLVFLYARHTNNLARLEAIDRLIKEGRM